MRRVERVGLTLFGLVLANGVACAVLSLAWGGSAANGKQLDGRFYLGSHGRYTEVSEGRWRANRAHHTSVFVTLPLGAAGAAVAGWADSKRRARRGTGPAVTDDFPDAPPSMPADG